MNNLKDLMLDQLNELYNAEIQLRSNLDKMAAQTSHEDLRHTFEIRSKRIEKRVALLEHIFLLFNEKPEERYSYIMEGIGKEIQSFLDRLPDTAVRDAGFIVIAQKSTRYKVTLYDILRDFANELNNNEVKKILTEALYDENEDDHQLMNYALSGVNQRAKNSNAFPSRFATTHLKTKK